MFFNLKIRKTVGRITTTTTVSAATKDDVDEIFESLNKEGFYLNREKANEFSIFQDDNKQTVKIGSIGVTAYFA